MERSRRKIQTRTKKEKKIAQQQGTGIRCPNCGGTSKVKSTESLPKKSIMWRYRKCDDCGVHFYTKEKYWKMSVPKNK